MNEIAKIAGGEIVVADPFQPEKFHNAADVTSLIKSATARLALRVQQFVALGNLDEAPIEAVKTFRRNAEDDDAILKDFDGSVKNALLELSGFKAYIVQTKGGGARIDPISVRGKLAEMIKACKAREDAEKPAEPTHTYFYAVTATDSEHVKLQSAIKKIDGGFGFVSPQKDAEWKTAAKLFGKEEK